MTDERPDHDSGDDEQSEESSDAEVINGNADDQGYSCPRHADEVQSILPTLKSVSKRT